METKQNQESIWETLKQFDDCDQMLWQFTVHQDLLDFALSRLDAGDIAGLRDCLKTARGLFAEDIQSLYDMFDELYKACRASWGCTD